MNRGHPGALHGCFVFGLLMLLADSTFSTSAIAAIAVVAIGALLRVVGGTETTVAGSTVKDDVPHQPSVAPTTTLQEDVTAAGQRRVNLIWEYTQGFIAIAVVISNMIVGVYMGCAGKPSGDYPFILSSALFLIVGFYFSRTNHAAIGGVGPKPEQKYEGR